MKLAWRSAVVLVTLLFIYILFPIFLVPSKLPVIDEAGPTDASIFQVEVERVPTLKDTIKDLQIRHRQGMQIILQSIK